MTQEYEAFTDDPDTELAEVLKEAARRRPNLAGGFEDAAARQYLLGQLIKIRKDLKITQRQVAERMQTTQSAVSDLECGSVDPYFSTLQRYARAVTARLRVRVDFPHDAAWTDTWMYERTQAATHVNVAARPARAPVGSSSTWRRIVETQTVSATPAEVSR
ncbi:helix-turn-helix transcriptional regulator [Hamadaea sp. NPDC050747]|uniref:helix-turn-helix domain-containing protein n=1 Tax=Hamadaea sp. NPDC050747 TaxID=3155789 RepID=UPI0033D2FCF4